MAERAQAATRGEEIRERGVSLGRAEIAVREWGRPDAHALVFVHQGTPAGNGLHFAELAPLLARRHGLRVVAPDMPGYGDSPPAPTYEYDPRSMADLVVDLLDELGIERASYVGHSWGGSIGCHVAERHPRRIDSLVLLDSGYQDLSDVPDFGGVTDLLTLTQAMQQAEAGLRFASWEQAVAALREESSRWTPELERAWRAGMVVADDGSVRSKVSAEVWGAVLHGIAEAPCLPTFDALRESGLPVLLLTATEPADDQPLRERCIERFQAALPAAEVRREQGARHDLIGEVGPPLAAEIGEWLAGGVIPR